MDETPLMKQYADLKAQAGDAMLLFRMGDFYELFGDDAVEAARILEITLTSRDKSKPNPTPMAGVPHHSVQGYIQRLLKAGKKVAIGEQMEDPNSLPKGVKIVRREIVRIFTPGVQFDAEGAEANYLAALVPGERGQFALACLDASTGETLVGDLNGELPSLAIRHLLLLGTKPAAALGSLSGVLVEELPSNYLSQSQATELLKDHYGFEDFSGVIGSPAAARAVAVAVHYTLRTQLRDKLAHLRIPSPLYKPKSMVLGPRTPQHLDLVPGADGTPSLFELINRTRSAIGARQLRRWLLAPLKDPFEIRSRQDAVRELSASVQSVEKGSAELAEAYDLERISARVNTGLANPRDTLALGRTLATLPRLAAILAPMQSSLLADLRQKISSCAAELSELGNRIVQSQRDDAPLISREGGIFNVGTSAELDRLLSLGQDGQRWLIELEGRERAATGIPTLKVRYNRVFGYYLEITQAHLKNVPPHYQRKQTMVGAERFFTEELKKFEDEIVNASSRQRALELDLFNELLQAIQQKTSSIMEAARVLGELDALLALAKLGHEPGWAFPEIDGSLELTIHSGRHPLVDAASRGAFVPNDLHLDASSRRTLIITGPNMGGKSTVMRQTALILILGQIGAPVPAQEARWGAVSSLFTRIGAHDAIARGQSTFMVEMSELAHILHHADERSLIILDEIGRGTSTYDGISVAWAALEWICTKVRSRTLFATHYHELTRLASALPAAANAHMAVQGSRGTVDSGSLRFLYKLRDGAANESFGIHVAQIAGLPKAVIQRAWKVLDELERHSPHAAGQSSDQLSLFGAAAEQAIPEFIPEPVQEVEPVAQPNPVLEQLRAIDVNSLTPIQALNLIAELQERSREFP